jgi:hypothetical protein
MHNKSLSKLKFAESESSPWNDQAKSEFINMLKGHKHLTKVKFDSADGSDNSNFKQEIKFYVSKMKKCH